MDSTGRNSGADPVPPPRSQHPGLSSSRSLSSVGGLSRSSRSGSLAVILASTSPTPSSPIFDSEGSSESSSRDITPPSTAMSTTGGGSTIGPADIIKVLVTGPLPPPPTSSDSGYSYYGTGTGGTTTPNSGFVVTSRPKPYFPPSNASSTGSTSSLLRNQPSSSTLLAQLPPSRQEASSAPPLSATHVAPRYLHSDYHSHLPSSRPTATGQNSPLPPVPLPEPKTTLTLSSSIDSKGRRMVNQYVRLKTIGQGSHGKVWLCAEPTEELLEVEGGNGKEKEREREKRQWEEEIESGEVKYCAIKSVAREGVGRGKSLKTAKVRKAERDANGTSTSTGIGADDKVKREVAIMKRLDHKNVVRLKEVIDDYKSKKVFMVLEFMAGGQIVWQDDDKNPTMTVDEARRTFRDVVLGLEYLHYQGIIHRDIKPANLLWTEDHNTVKISDFGVSHVSDALLRASPATQPDGLIADDIALRKTAGSPAFFAPELLHAAEASNSNTPQTIHRSSPSTIATQAEDGYFFRPPTPLSSSNASPSSLSTPPSSRLFLDSPTTPNGTRRTDFIISKPLPPSDPNKPRRRPTIGKAIDVWALGVTLYCLLFGDTPFMAQTEYELYNVIVREGVRVPEKMGKEGAWTGIGKGWEGASDGVEGREVVDLLARLLEKDPSKRITLAEVKKHPWVLRKLPSSPDSWLCETDPSQTHAVVVTEEDVQQATQQRGAVDVLPQIRNRTGLRRALHAALVRFPAFSYNRKHSDAATNNDDSELFRRISTSSTSQSAFDGTSEAGPSRHPSDSSTRQRSHPKNSNEYAGLDLRRILSGKDGSPPPSAAASPANGKASGGWAYRTSSVGSGAGKRIGSGGAIPEGLVDLGGAELWKSSSTSSVGGGNSTSTQGGGGRALSLHLFPPRRKSSDQDHSSTRSASPGAGMHDVDSTGGRRTLSKVLSLLGGGGTGSRSRTNTRSSDATRSVLSDDEDSSSSAPPPPTPRKHLPTDRRRGSLTPSQTPSGVIPLSRVDLDASDFEYSSEEDNEDEDDIYEDEEGIDELARPPLAEADSVRGWNSGLGQGSGGVDFQSSFSRHDQNRDKGTPTPPSSNSNPQHTETTPRPSDPSIFLTSHFNRGFDLHPSVDPPPLVRQHVDPSSNPASTSRPGQGVRVNSSIRDGSISSGIEGQRKWTMALDSDEEEEEEEEEEGTEIFLAPRRRAATLSRIE